jgi:hypothetical protein
MKTSTLEKPMVSEIQPLAQAISAEFLKLAHDFIVTPADFDNDQGLTIRDDILLLTQQPLPKEMRKVLKASSIIEDNVVYLTSETQAVESIIIEDNVMYKLAPKTKTSIIEDNYIYLYQKPNANPLRSASNQTIVVTGATARLIERAKGVVIRDDVMLRNQPQGSMVAMPVQNFGPRRSEATLFLLAIQPKGAAAPKVGKLRAKFDRLGRIQSLSLTNAANQSIGKVHFESIGVHNSERRVFDEIVTIYVDGFPWMTVPYWDVDFWTNSWH